MAVPSDPQDTDQSFKFPNVAQDLLAQCSLLTQVITEGGRVVPVVDNDEEENELSANDGDEDGNNTDDGSDDA